MIRRHWKKLALAVAAGLVVLNECLYPDAASGTIRSLIRKACPDISADSDDREQMDRQRVTPREPKPYMRSGGRAMSEQD